MATLKVTVHEARDLPIMDRTTGTADPYVMLKFGELEHTTDIIHSTRYPRWNRDFRFDVSDLSCLQEEPLEVRLYDHDIISRDDIVGFLIFDCNCILYQGIPSIAGWFPLYDTTSGIRGDIRLTIRVKFHSAENPIIPSIPVRYVQRLALREEVFCMPNKREKGARNSYKGKAAGNKHSDPFFSGNSSSRPLPSSLKGLRTEEAPDDAIPLREKTLDHTSRCLPLQRSAESEQYHRKGNAVVACSNVCSHLPCSSGFGVKCADHPSPCEKEKDDKKTNEQVRHPETHNLAVSSSIYPTIRMNPRDFEEPLEPNHVQHQSLTSEEEGILIFTCWRLDPSIYRVETILSMTEELIVTGDPEHSRLTNLRSIRSTNEARVIELFKLSGKVRRQLARKVVEMKCNAVVGYVEEFDMDPNGIVVRAYGTPCVVSSVHHIVDKKNSVYFDNAGDVNCGGICAKISPALSASDGQGQISLQQNSVPPMMLPPSVLANLGMQEANSNFIFAVQNTEGGDGVGVPRESSRGFNTVVLKRGHPTGIKSTERELSAQNNIGGTISPTYPFPSLIHPSAGMSPSGVKPCQIPNAPIGAVGVVKAGLHINPVTEKQGDFPVPRGFISGYNHNTVNTTNSPSYKYLAEVASSPNMHVIMLTVKDVPYGIVQRIGGHICARSVKIVSKVKSKELISQERDEWWIELREELKANARAFHCNVILGYEEEAQYHEDVILLSLFGTAVVIDPSLFYMRCGPEYLFRLACERIERKTNCSILHLDHSPSRKADFPGDQEQLHHSVCGVCRNDAVPDALLASCTLPLGVDFEGLPRLVHVAVAKSKKTNLKGVELAVAVSQALPFIEFSLHKQLMFNLKLMRMNACFGVKVSIVLGEHTILGTLTGTGCRVVGLPIPAPPVLQILDPIIMANEIVGRLRRIVERRQRQHAQTELSKNGKDFISPQGSCRRCEVHKKKKKKKENDSVSSLSTSTTLSTHTQHSFDKFSSSRSAADGSTSCLDGPDRRTRGGAPPPHSQCGSLTALSDPENSIHITIDDGSGVILSAAGNTISDYVVKIDDEEEAEAMLGMADTTNFEDSLLLTVPYMADSTNTFSFQQRVVLDRRFSTQRHSPQAGAFAGNTAHVTTGTFNECCADAKRAFVQHACRVALRSGGRKVEVLRVVNFSINSFFEPNSGELHMRLEGCLLTGYAVDKFRIEKLEDRAFQECLRYAGGDAPSAKEGAMKHSSYRAVDPGINVCELGVEKTTKTNERSAFRADALGNGVSTVTTSPRMYSYSTEPCSITVGDPLYQLHRNIFINCTAPYSLPYVMNRSVPPLRLLIASGATDTSALSFRPDMVYPRKNEAERQGMISRQWQALTSLASSAFRNFIERAGVSSDGKGPERRLGANARVRNSSFVNQIEPSQYHPAQRLPSNFNTIVSKNPQVVFTPLDFVSGKAIVRYIGRLSLHFIRQADDIDTQQELGMFFQRTEFEVQCVVQAHIRLMAGNALLHHKVTFHEVWDSDGSSGAFLFLTVTGDIAQTTESVLVSSDIGGAEKYLKSPGAGRSPSNSSYSSESSASKSTQ